MSCILVLLRENTFFFSFFRVKRFVFEFDIRKRIYRIVRLRMKLISLFQIKKVFQIWKRRFKKKGLKVKFSSISPLISVQKDIITEKIRAQWKIILILLLILLLISRKGKKISENILLNMVKISLFTIVNCLLFIFKSLSALGLIHHVKSTQ